MRSSIQARTAFALGAVLLLAACGGSSGAGSGKAGSGPDDPYLPRAVVAQPVRMTVAQAQHVDLAGTAIGQLGQTPAEAGPLVASLSAAGHRGLAGVQAKARMALHLPPTAGEGTAVQASSDVAGDRVLRARADTAATRGQPRSVLPAASAMGVSAGAQGAARAADPAALAAAAAAAPSKPGDMGDALGQVLGIATFLGDGLTGATPTMKPNFSESAGGATTSLGLEVGRSANGSITAGFALGQSADKATTHAAVRTTAHVEGPMCPDANGMIDLKFTGSYSASVSNGTTGAAGSTQLEGTVSALVGDDAYIMQLEVSGDAHVTRPTSSTGQGSVDIHTTVSRSGRSDQPAIGSQGKTNLTGHSGDLTAEQATSMAQDGAADLVRMGQSLMIMREIGWQTGSCVEVLADAPQRVKPGASTKIDVKVRHKVDGTSLEVPVDVTLTGGEKVDPTKIDKAPGAITHTAVNERGKTAKITLTSTSRRGIGTKTLTISTGGGYEAHGQTGQEIFSGTICDPSKPFTLKGSGGADVTLSFVPTSDTGGTMSYSGKVNNAPMTLSGKGTYTLDEGDIHSTLTFTESGTVHQAGSATNTTVLTLTPTSACPN